MNKVRIVIVIILMVLAFAGCKNKSQYRIQTPCNELEDTLYRVKCLDILPPIEIMERWKEYPDSITAAFTKNGIVEDSVTAYRNGGLLDSVGNYYSPAYIFTAAVGDAWIYDSNGKFVYFYCTPLPHSGQGHSYNP